MNTKPTIAIVDYGVGNLWSLQKALDQFAEVIVTEEVDKINTADGIVLPGVGSFKAGMDGLKVRGLDTVIKERAAAGIPLLGICLGAQLLLQKSYEFGEHEGLGIIGGSVERFPELPQGVTIPAIGWQEVRPSTTDTAKMLFTGIDKPYFYFVHSYVLKPSLGADIATTSYGGYDYCAAAAKGTVYGVQFHPEKSGQAGLKLLNNFVNSIA